MKTKIEKILLQMCLMDDTFMTVAMDGNTEAISHIISTVLQRYGIKYYCTNRHSIFADQKQNRDMLDKRGCSENRATGIMFHNRMERYRSGNKAIWTDRLCQCQRKQRE